MSQRPASDYFCNPQYDQQPQALTRERGVLWLVDRAFFDAAFWDKKKRRLGSTMITPSKTLQRIACRFWSKSPNVQRLHSSPENPANPANPAARQLNSCQSRPQPGM